jgi:hypothetical protein
MQKVRGILIKGILSDLNPLTENLSLNQWFSTFLREKLAVQLDAKKVQNCF